MRAIFLTTLALSLSSSALASLLTYECRINEVTDSSYFEESVSTDEYPEVEMNIDQQTNEFALRLGANEYSSAVGDKISLEPSTGHSHLYYLIPNNDAENTITIWFEDNGLVPGAASGGLSVFSKKNPNKAKLLARFSCI